MEFEFYFLEIEVIRGYLAGDSWTYIHSFILGFWDSAQSWSQPSAYETPSPCKGLHKGTSLFLSMLSHFISILYPCSPPCTNSCSRVIYLYHCVCVCTHEHSLVLHVWVVCNFNLNTQSCTEALILFGICVTQHCVSTRLYLVKCTSSPLLLTTVTSSNCPPPSSTLPWACTHTASRCSGWELLQHVYSGGKLLGHRYKIFYLRKKYWLALQNVCACLRPHLQHTGRLVPCLLPTLGLILLSNASPTKNSCCFHLHFSDNWLAWANFNLFVNPPANCQSSYLYLNDVWCFLVYFSCCSLLSFNCFKYLVTSHGKVTFMSVKVKKANHFLSIIMKTVLTIPMMDLFNRNP